ncbi:unnamed protein product [Nippostrongylus brasiliensis]|uniref:Testis-expressed sequence 10 protein (inferred by orthology to a human protein) n=1 Tax=Nippostrongylus brasiliensis TaxID=27835 RepID=A0A0N4YK64_NIPBR|nr:unnamed protein product [Nippostrongylus brasiliensis]
MVTKKKARKNADFKKVKLKVGKKLKKTTTTDTSISTKKVVLISQLQEKTESEGKPLSYRGLSLDELCKQLGHFNKSVRRDALLGTKQLLVSRPDLVQSQLRTLIPAVSRLIPDCGHDPALNGQLRALLRVVCSVPAGTMASHFRLFVAHLLHALTHSELGVRNFAFSVIGLLLTTYPDLCRNNEELFTTFVKYVGSSRRPNWNSPKFLETIEAFVRAYIVNHSNRNDFCKEVEVNLSTGEISSSVNLARIFAKRNPFDFGVITSSASALVSPLEVPDSLLKLCEACSPIVAQSLAEDKAGSLLRPTLALLTLLGDATLKLPNAFLVPDLGPQMAKIWAPVIKVAKTRKNDKVATATRWIIGYQSSNAS